MTREPVTNLINNMMGAAGALTELDPELTKKLIGSLLVGLEKGNEHLESNKKSRGIRSYESLERPRY